MVGSQQANHGWTSMQGRVVFWFRILHGIENGYYKGEVVFKLYGQKCDRCAKDVRCLILLNLLVIA